MILINVFTTDLKLLSISQLKKLLKKNKSIYLTNGKNTETLIFIKKIEIEILNKELELLLKEGE